MRDRRVHLHRKEEKLNKEKKNKEQQSKEKEKKLNLRRPIKRDNATRKIKLISF